MNKNVIAPVVAALLFAACTKSNSNNNTNPPPNPPAGGTLIKTFTLVAYNPSSGVKLDSSVNNYSYDTKNRLVAVVVNDYDFSSSPSGQLTTDSASETYTSSTISDIRQRWKAGVKQQTVSTTYYLNTAGKLADSAHQSTVSYPGPVTTDNVSKNSFDANGFLTKQDIYLLQAGNRNLATEITCTNAGGNTNAVVITTYLIPGNLASGLQTATAFTFSSQTSGSAMLASTGNDLNLIIGIAGNGINIMHSNANLVQSVTVAVNGSVVETENLSYVSDSQNRFTAISYKLSTGILVSKAYYTYQ